ncbi:MAG TPA: hypothetical protein VE974_12795 [Thermoanaerobaculia bacterium]|nr:hypothetical protein [Thermoanaerobaculia bacterium]
MGIVLWLISGATAFAVARIVPFARTARWFGEVFVTLSAAILLGVAATALDFGGWREPDWRAALFAFLGAFAAAGVFRLTMLRNPGGPS